MSEFSGRQWCGRFLPSQSLDDLTDTPAPPAPAIPDFRKNAKRFVEALESGGATVTIADTWRPAERAYLMHFCCLIVGYTDKQGVYHQIAPADVPPMAGVDIDWTCGGNGGVALRNAAAMVGFYGIRFPAALISRHTQRLAVDMNIRIPPGRSIVDAKGVSHLFTTYTDGSDARVIAIGATFGVIKLVSDPPHWSADGH